MTRHLRSILALTVFAIVLAACGMTTGAPSSDAPSPSQPAVASADPSVEPTEAPSPTPAVFDEADVAGTITVAEMAFSGPGATVQEAIDLGPTEGDLPRLVNGVLFRAEDGTVYLASGVGDVEAPTFDGPMLEVLNTDNDGPGWDMANAELLGLEEANGIVFRQGTQVLGFIELP